LTTIKNHQANGILNEPIKSLEISSGQVASLLKTSSPSLPNKELLMPVMWAINSIFHTTLKASPAQLVFNHDIILPTSFTANWYTINSHQQKSSITICH
jgi:hypothetical protein